MVISNNEKMILYVKLQKYLYGYIRAALIFKENLSRDLQGMGFILNLYNTCVKKNGKWSTLYHIMACK